MAIRKRTNLKHDPDRNLQLSDGEVQLEGFGGAISIGTDRGGSLVHPSPITYIRAVNRGYKNSSATVRLDAENLDAFIEMLIEARSKL